MVFRKYEKEVKHWMCIVQITKQCVLQCNLCKYKHDVKTEYFKLIYLSLANLSIYLYICQSLSSTVLPSNQKRYLSMSYLCAQASNAEKASESSFRQVSTMLPGAPGFNDLQQLSLAHAAKGSKEEVFVREVANIGEILPLKIEARQLQSINKRHYVVPVRMVVEYLAEFYPHKLLPSPALGDVEKILTDFWASFKVLHPNHPVYQKYNGTLKNCIPMKIHSDEGTGLRKSAVLQVSWGPVLTQTGNSLDRYFFWTCMNAEDYKAYNKGYAAGNEVLDELAEMLAGEITSLFETGVKCKGMTFYLCWVALEGDLPAQARAFHCKRNFGCVPNAMRYWCLANDNDYPFTDPSRTALWRSTLSASPPWTGSSPSPFLKIPGGDADVFLAKDLFHLCHLGAVRTFAVNALCFLVSDNHFAPCMIYFYILGTFSSFFG